MPRKYRAGRFSDTMRPGSFNEAGADAPEIPAYWCFYSLGTAAASMRPGRMPRKYLGNRLSRRSRSWLLQ